MQLLPIVVSVEDPGTRQADAIAHARRREMIAIARHEFDDEVAAELRPVHRVG
jgi:hypothetical protein